MTDALMTLEEEGWWETDDYRQKVGAPLRAVIEKDFSTPFSRFAICMYRYDCVPEPEEGLTPEEVARAHKINERDKLFFIGFKMISPFSTLPQIRRGSFSLFSSSPPM